MEIEKILESKNIRDLIMEKDEFSIRVREQEEFKKWWNKVWEDLKAWEEFCQKAETPFIQKAAGKIYKLRRLILNEIGTKSNPMAYILK